MKKIYFVLLILFPLLYSCHKKDQLAAGNSTEVKNAIQKSIDNYLWYAQLPSNFKSKHFNDPAGVMDFIHNYSYVNAVNRNVDKWSFAISQTDWDDIQNGIAGDFGINVQYMTASDLRVRTVEKLSPAGIAGVKRGWKLLTVNDRAITDNTDATINFLVKAIYQSNTVKINFQKPDGNAQLLTLNTATYKEQPIYLDSIYNRPSGKTAYLVLNSFIGDTTYIKNGFNTAFSRYGAQGVKDVIIDLRYNGGGYVFLSQLMANYLAPKPVNTSLMMKEVLNDKLSRYNEETNFQTVGPLNLNRVYFIVSGFTASASELLINNLNPHMSVKLIGEPTEGKSVGYVDWEVGNNWLVFPVMFQSLNSTGYGDFFNGLGPQPGETSANKKYVDPHLGLNKDWGDVSEACLAAALQAIDNNGVFFVTPGQPTISRALAPGRDLDIQLKGIQRKGLPGMIERRGRF